MKQAGSPVEPHYTLQEAVERFFPGGHITVRSLRTEMRKGRLCVTEVAGKFLVSETAIAEMLERCRTCRVQGNDRASISRSGERLDTMYGSSETARLESARAAARTTLAELKKPSRGTSRRNTNRLVRFRPPSSTSTKS